MAHIIDFEIKNKRVHKIIIDDDIVVQKRIADLAHVNLISTTGSVTLNKNLDGNARLFAKALNNIRFKGEFNSDTFTKMISDSGEVRIEGDGSTKKNLNSQAHVMISAEGNVFLRSDLNSNCNLEVISKTGGVRIIGDINSHAKLSIIAEGNIALEGDINSNVRVEMISTRGAIRIDGHVHSESITRLTAKQNIDITEDVNGNISLMARSGGIISIRGDIDNHALVLLEGMRGINIGGKISGESVARLAISSGDISIRGNIEHDARIEYWPEAALELHGSGSEVAFLNQWTIPNFDNEEEAIEGSWWTNWFWSYGYISNRIARPDTREKLVEIIRGVDENQHVKALGGSWSFSDISLPMYNEVVGPTSIIEKGRNQKRDLRQFFRHMEDKDTPMDLYPAQVFRTLNQSTRYNQRNLEMITRSGIDLPALSSLSVPIDTRGLKSSLQCQLPNKEFVDPDGNTTYYFWVEAGITMSELNALLDHQDPRLAIQASGGSPGATLAGTLSTATHGGEFADPLLVDRVKAIHFVGPDGTEWWIEGDRRILEESDLIALYGDGIKFLDSTASLPDSLTTEDFLKTIVVSMGAIGIIYSLVLEVVPQFSIQQITRKVGSWEKLLEEAGTGPDALRVLNTAANRSVFEYLIDGRSNGTGIPLEENRYVDLAINPFSKTCWVINRRFIDRIAVNEKNAGDLISNYISGVTQQLSEGAEKAEIDGQLLGRMLDFMSLPRDIPGILALAIFESNVFTKFIDGITDSPMMLHSLMSNIHAKATWNRLNERDPTRDYGFLGDILEGVLNALQATYEQPVSDITGLSYKVGAIGWPADGIPGRGFEVALPVNRGFSYMQQVLDLLDSANNQGNSFMGYISTRICPRTETVMGMQQFDKSIMVEIVGHRSPEANTVFNDLITFTKGFDLINDRTMTSASRPSIFPIFHWGLETEGFDSDYLNQTTLSQPYRPGIALTRLEVFNSVKEYLTGDHGRIFDNAFTDRMGL